MYDESDDELNDYEYPDDDVLYDDDLDDPDNYSDVCPNCDASIYDDADYCPRCGEFIPLDTSPFAGRPAIWTVLGIIGIAAVIATIVFGSM